MPPQPCRGLILSMVKFLQTHWFLAGLFGAIGLASVAPDLVPATRPSVSNLAVFFIFLINGLILPTESILGGLARWRIHAFVHVFLFIGTPLLVIVAIAPARPWLSDSLISGFILLSALPCTISTSIVYAVRAGGSLAPAIFNATSANLMGILLTPFVVGLLAPQSGGAGIDPVTAFANTASMVLPPVLIGQILRQFLRGWATRRKPQLNTASSLLILVVAYVAFADSVRAGVGTSAGFPALLLVAALCAFLFGIQTCAAAVGIRWMNLPADDAITAFVCSTQKTLAAGIPLANAIFAGTSVNLGVALLPLLVFYTLQLFLGDLAIRTLCRRVH